MGTNHGESKTFAFTLAEVLITLGIIGVVAAMTIPTLISNTQKKEALTRFKSAYAQLNQAVKLSISDNGDIAGWDVDGKDWFDTYLSNYLKIQTQPFKSIAFDDSIPYKESSGKRESGLAILSRNNSMVYTLLNGIDLIVDTTDYSDGDPKRGIIVDTNGRNSKPNQFGKDTFYLIVDTEHGGLTPLGKWGGNECTPPVNGNPDRNWYKNTSCLNYGCNKNGRGMYCAGLIIADNWTIAKDYPW